MSNVVTPELRLLQKIVAMPTAKLRNWLEVWRKDHPGMLQHLQDGQRDYAEEQERYEAREDGREPWEYGPAPFPVGDADVWGHGDPPEAGAIRTMPRLRVPSRYGDTSREPETIAWSLHFRARAYERLVRGVLHQIPALATATTPEELRAVNVRDVERSGCGAGSKLLTMRGLAAVRVQTVHGIWFFEQVKSDFVPRRLASSA